MNSTSTADGRLLAAAAAALLSIVCAVAIWFAGAGTALAPNESRTTSYLGTTSASSIWIKSNTATTAYYMSSTNWTVSSIPVGSPCTSIANVGNNYDLIHVVVGNGPYRRCSG